MEVPEALQVGLWLIAPLVAVIVLYEGAVHLRTNWPKVGEWCERCRRPMQGDPVTGSICDACEPLGPTRAMRRRAEEEAARAGFREARLAARVAAQRNAEEA